MRRVVPVVITLVLSAGALTTCATSTNPGSASPTSGTTGAFPQTVEASNGPVKIDSRPTRIMSLSATATSMLFDMGAGHQVVAVDKYSTDPPDAPRTALTGFETGPESYVRYHPDLVILAQDQGSLSSQLAGLGIATLILPAATKLSDTYSQITLLGKATGHEPGAATENASIRHGLAAIVSSVGTKDRGVTYYQELDPTLYTATSHTFIGALYGSLGMVNIADAAIATGNNYPQLSPESLIEANPDYVFLADSNCCGQSASKFSSRPGFSTIRAVRLHHVFTIPDSIASQWGPRVVVFLQMVAQDLKPGSSN